MYVLSQVIGAVLAALTTWAVFGAEARSKAGLAATAPAPETSFAQVFLVEAVVTFVLVFIVVSVATDERVPAAAAGLAVGLALMAGVMIAGPVWGGAVNPARALGPMLVAGRYDAWWIYVVGPIAGESWLPWYDRFIAKASAPE